MHRSATYDFLLTCHSNHGPISYRFRDKRRFQSKVANPLPPYFVPPLTEFSLELGISAGVKKLEWWRYEAEQWAWRYLRLCGYNPPTWQTDGQTDGHRATAKTRLRIASRGKNYTNTKIDRVWFSRLLRHSARKLSGSILTTSDPRGDAAE